jgi:preprotein translocase SecE subunit
MSVAENATMERTARNPQQELAIGSFIGAAGLLWCLLIVFGSLPMHWHEAWASAWKSNEALAKNIYLADALLILIEIGVIVALAVLAYRLLQAHMLPGLRAGVFFAAVYFSVALLLVALLGSQLSADLDAAVGIAIMVVALAVLLGLAGYVYLMVPGWRNFLEAVETQGWFHGISYKGNQGVRVRRGTIVGILVIGAFGIHAMYAAHFFGTERPELPNDWYWTVPFVTDPVRYVPLMFKVHVIMPVILGMLLIWLAYRIVNVPTFADFLIATEAEMNKVSWTTRKRLLQDTIVVLTTVFLFTTYLFVWDIILIKVLSNPYIQVLLIDPREQAQKQQETAKW